jgi:hypothetical protein
MPNVELPPAIALTCHVTPVFVVLETEATNDCVAPVATLALPGNTATATCAIVTCAVPERVGSAADTAVTVTVAGDGIFAGAV